MNKKFITTRQLVLIGLLTGISIVLDILQIGFIPTPTMNFTFMHVPAIIGAILEGPLVGAICGFMFGSISFVKAITTPTPMSFIFMDPIISIGARVLMGFVAGYTFKVLKNVKSPIRIGISAFLASLTNTVGVLSLTWFLHAKQYATLKNIDLGAVKKVLYGIATVNGLPEALIAVAMVTPIVLATRKVIRPKKELVDIPK